MGRDAFGFFSGFLSIGLILLTTATFICFAIAKYTKQHKSN
jgi:hypothetical protein